MKRAIIFLFCAISIWGTEQEIISTTEHSIQTKRGDLEYTATSGFLHYQSPCKKKAKLFYTAYFKKNEEPTNRPITFCFNGGPGSSSVWLHMGAFGPKRFITKDEGQQPNPPYNWTTNHETLLFDTDLVFLDPIGTGYSTTEEEADLPYFCDAQHDVESISDSIRLFLTTNKRWLSPKYLAGESYGTTRAATISEYLHMQGIFLNGIVLVSTAIDLSMISSVSTNFLNDALRLPSYIATAWHYKKYAEGSTLEDTMEKAKSFAMNKYFPALLRGNTLSKNEKEELAISLSEFCSISKNHFLKNHLKIELDQFSLLFMEEEGKKIGLYDSRLNHYTSDKYWNFLTDPSITSIEGIFTGGFNAYLAEELEISSPTNYFTFNVLVNASWSYPNNSWQAYSTFDSLQRSLEVNPNLKVFVASGYYDLVTPFAAAEHLFSLLNDPYHQNVEIHNYEGGHMLYLDRKAHIEFASDLQQYYGK